MPLVPASRDEQRRTALHLQAQGAALLVPSDELSGARLFSEVSALLRDPERRRAMAQAMARQAPRQPTRKLAALVLEHARPAWAPLRAPDPGPTLERMNVRFRRTGARRYAVLIDVAGQPARAMDPAPGYDDDIPHDLVHYLVEAELGLKNGVYGRAAQGAGTFVMTAEQDQSPRERARQQRKLQKRERALGAQDARHSADMDQSERLAALCDVAWRRKHGQRPDLGRAPPLPRTADAECIARVVARLDALAPLWRALPVGEELVFEWPKVLPGAVSAPGPAAGRAG